MTMILCGCIPRQPFERHIAREGDIVTNVSIVDEQGDPILGADVWRIASPSGNKDILNRPEVNKESLLEYLDRLAIRHKNNPEFASDRRFKPISNFQIHNYPRIDLNFNILDSTDSQGKTKEIIKYKNGRYDPVTVKYTALKYGYLPTNKTLSINVQENQATVKISMRRDKNIVLHNGKYQDSYYKIRRGLWSDEPNKKAPDGEKERKKLSTLAQKAEAAGDLKFAARMYSYIPYTPTYIKTHASANNMSVFQIMAEPEDTERNMEVLRKAASLDPQNRYIQMRLLILDPPIERSERIRSIEKLIKTGRDDIWPIIFERLEDAYYADGQSEKAYKELLWYKAFEPLDSRNLPKSYKLRLARYLTVEEFKNSYINHNNPNKEDENKILPIQYAVQAGRIDIYKWLRNNGVNKVDSKLYRAAINSNSPDMVDLIISTVYDIPHTNVIKEDIRTLETQLLAREKDRENNEAIISILKTYLSKSVS